MSPEVFRGGIMNALPPTGYPSAGWQPPPPQPPRKNWMARHKVWTAIIAVVGVFAVLVIIGAVIGSPSKTKVTASGAGSTPTPTPTPAAVRSPVPPPLSPGELKFVAAIRSGFGRPGYSNTGTDAQIASVASQICYNMGTGASISDEVHALKKVNQWALPSGKIVKAAVKDLCRKYLPKPPRVIARFNGSGTQNTRPFTVPAQWHLSWAYWGCSGGNGNFAVTEANTDGSDDLNGVTVNELGSGRGPVATYAYGDSGTHYFQVLSECSWSLAVVVGG